MANWGLMMGLGEGMSQLGGQVFKAKFLDKLKEEETVRAEKRKEAKDAGTIKEQKYINKDGVWYEQDVNVNGKVIDERLAPKNKVDEFGREEQKATLGIEALVLGNKKAQREEGYAAEDRARQVRMDEAKIKSEEADVGLKGAQSDYYRSGGSSGSRASAEAEAAGPEDYVQELIKQSADLKRQYVFGKNPKMTAAEFQDLARKVVVNAAQQGIDPRTAFAEAIKRFINDPRTKKDQNRGLEAMVEEDELE